MWYGTRYTNERKKKHHQWTNDTEKMKRKRKIEMKYDGIQQLAYLFTCDWHVWMCDTVCIDYSIVEHLLCGCHFDKMTDKISYEFIHFSMLSPLSLPRRSRLSE